MPSPLFINREQSWLDFNERVLCQAENTSLPLLERVKFLAITASNLDEFFMVRVGGLHILKQQDRRDRDPSGLTPNQQLAKIRKQVLRFVKRQYQLLHKILLPELAKKGIRRILPHDATPSQKSFLRNWFLENAEPVITPIAVHQNRPFPVVPALQLGILCATSDPSSNFPAQSVIFLPPFLPRHVPVPVPEGETTQNAYMNLEDVVTLFLGTFFPDNNIDDHAIFRISRNSDIAIDDESDADLAESMEQILDKRKNSDTIRLEVSSPVSPTLINTLQLISDATPDMIYRITGDLDLTSYFNIASLPNFDDLKVSAWPPRNAPGIEKGANIFDSISQGDILLFHPYQSFDPVLALIEQAATDPNVLAIKQVLYRTAKKSRIISALIRAAESGKSVTVLVELKARFDEARNLERAEELIRAGVQIIYGVKHFKTHAKICLVIRREGTRLKRYAHFGTGNYNEATAQIYTDISLLTCGHEYGLDASSFFNAVTGLSQPTGLRLIAIAPFFLRERILTLIEEETERARQGHKAEILLKMNSLQDTAMIEALYRASRAGVTIMANIRGICCLRPGVTGHSENIRVISIVDRYLEHARICYFHKGGFPEILISSADWMVRNLDKRVELLIPIVSPPLKKELTHILQQHFQDNVNAWELNNNGTWDRVPVAKPRKRYRTQEKFATWAAQVEPGAATTEMLIPQKPGGN